MNASKQSGTTTSTVVLISGLSLLLMLALGFGGWAFLSRQDYKNNSDTKSATAVKNAENSQKTKLEKEFAEREKSPFKIYQSSSTFGNITFSYPKTWSAYVAEEGDSVPLTGFFHPGIVPAVVETSAYALRLELSTTSYEQVLLEFEEQTKQGAVRSSAYLPPKLKGKANAQPGVKLEGTIAEGREGALIIVKLRDKTLKLRTDSRDYMTDFNAIINSLSYEP